MKPNFAQNEADTIRERGILAGLYLSKFDQAALDRLKFSGFKEAFNIIGYTLGLRPASIKNYRDEFDPLFPNKRKGWHGRPMRDYCRSYYEKYSELSINAFTDLIISFLTNRLPEPVGNSEHQKNSSFAQRLATGIAAEKYFEMLQPKIPEFANHSLENTTLLGCGYDYKLSHQASNTWIAVEVKGMVADEGNISLTQLEHQIAQKLGNQYYVFLARNFQETPRYTLYRAPLESELNFLRQRRVIVQISWTASV